MTTRIDFFSQVEYELAEARSKFPKNELLGYAFAEESGEFIKAMLDNASNKCDDLTGDVYKEAVQTVAMVIRLLEEGCPELKLRPILRRECK